MAGILDMSAELLDNILGHLDYVSLTFMRATCRKLYASPTESQLTTAFLDLEAELPWPIMRPVKGRTSILCNLCYLPIQLSHYCQHDWFHRYCFQRHPFSPCRLNTYKWLKSIPCYDCMRLLPEAKFGNYFNGKRRYCTDCAASGRWFHKIERSHNEEPETPCSYRITCKGCGRSKVKDELPTSEKGWKAQCEKCWNDEALAVKMPEVRARAMYARHQKLCDQESRMVVLERDFDWTGISHPMRAQMLRLVEHHTTDVMVCLGLLERKGQ